MKVSASILSADYSHLSVEIKRAEEAGVDLFHLDIMDGQFVPNLSFGPFLAGTISRLTTLPMHAHLMVLEPTWIIDAVVREGSNAVSVHAEACTHLHRTLMRIRELGASPGVALNPSTPLSAVEWVLADVDSATVMSVNPGFGGQKFITSMLAKISSLREISERLNPKLDIVVDGGVNDLTAKAVIEAGASTLVIGSHLFSAGDMRARVRAIRKLAD